MTDIDTNHPSVLESVNWCDVRCLVMDDSSSSEELSPAVGQIIEHDGHSVRTEDEHLVTPLEKLGTRNFGNQDGHVLRICPDTSSDVKKFLDQYCLRAATAVLVGPRLALTVGHRIAPRASASSFRFVFGRTHRSDLGAPNHHDETGRPHLRVSPDRWYRGERILARVDCRGLPDWALVELDREVEGVTPLAVAPYRRDANGVVAGHPLGLPLKVTPFIPVEQPSAEPRFSVWVDNDGGGSGSALMQDGALVGILRGRISPNPKLIRPGPPPCIDPGREDCKNAQPFTPSSYFADTITALGSHS